MANLTVNTKNYGQITRNTKPHLDPPELVHGEKEHSVWFPQRSECCGPLRCTAKIHR